MDRVLREPQELKRRNAKNPDCDYPPKPRHVCPTTWHSAAIVVQPIPCQTWHRPGSKINLGADHGKDERRLRVLGYDARWLLVDRGETAEAVVSAALQGKAFACALIGARRNVDLWPHVSSKSASIPRRRGSSTSSHRRTKISEADPPAPDALTSHSLG
jgi:hypothetical protein